MVGRSALSTGGGLLPFRREVANASCRWLGELAMGKGRPRRVFQHVGACRGLLGGTSSRGSRATPTFAEYGGSIVDHA